MGAREVLNKIKWAGKEKLSDVRITIIHRGAPENRREIHGKDIMELGSGFMKVMMPEGETYVPYHRITKIEVCGEMRYEKKLTNL
ncbi:MAG: RNA repair domain-containing protein [Candidatus Hadarchaeum sp.]